MIKFEVKGNVSRAVELAFSKSGVPYARIGMASNEYDSSGEQINTSFVTVTVFGDRARRAAEELGLGDLIKAEGRIQTSTREVDGKKIYNTDFLGDALTLVVKKQIKEAEPVVEQKAEPIKKKKKAASKKKAA